MERCSCACGEGAFHLHLYWTDLQVSSTQSLQETEEKVGCEGLQETEEKVGCEGERVDFFYLVRRKKEWRE